MGGGVYVSDSGRCTISDGTALLANWASLAGGAIAVDQGTMRWEDATRRGGVVR